MKNRYTVAVAGSMEGKVRYGGQESYVNVCVVEGDGPSLLGRNWLKVLKLDWRSIKIRISTSNKPANDGSLTKQVW